MSDAQFSTHKFQDHISNNIPNNIEKGANQAHTSSRDARFGSFDVTWNGEQSDTEFVIISYICYAE